MREALDAIETLRTLESEEKVLRVANVVAGFHLRRILPLMERPLRLDQMGNNADATLLARSKMSLKALEDDEIERRVKAACTA